MASLILELNINSASNLLNVNLITKMDVYAAITIHRENTRKKQKAKTIVDRAGGSNPIWNQAVEFSVNERLVRDGRLTLVMRLISRRVLGNKDIGGVSIPLLELLDSFTPSINSDNNVQEMNSMTYQVRTLSGKQAGFLTFSYRFKPDSPMIVNQNLVDIPTYPPLSQIENRPSAPPELPIEFPKLCEPPCFWKHPFAVGASGDPLPIPYDVGALEQARHAYNHTPPSSSLQGYELYGFVPPSHTRYEYGSSSNQQPKEIRLGLGEIESEGENIFDL